jgi:hypothetical protein
MRRISLLLLTTALLGSAGSDAGDPAPATRRSGDTCILTSQFRSWRVSPDAKSIFIRVQRDRFLRLELAAACPRLTWPDSRLITRWRGTTTIACNAFDWDLSVRQGTMPGPPVPCVVKQVHAMTPDEVAALPKDLRP